MRVCEKERVRVCVREKEARFGVKVPMMGRDGKRERQRKTVHNGKEIKKCLQLYPSGSHTTHQPLLQQERKVTPDSVIWHQEKWKESLRPERLMREDPQSTV